MGIFAEHVPRLQYCTLLSVQHAVGMSLKQSGILQQNVGAAGILEKSMGVLLVDFLRLFGRSLNNDDVGISCSNGGYFFNKLDAQKEQAMRPYMLSVEDPADPDNDLSKGSWNFLKVFDYFICRFLMFDVCSQYIADFTWGARLWVDCKALVYKLLGSRSQSRNRHCFLACCNN